MHQLTALLLALFVGLHLLAVAKHMLIDHDGLLLRMWPRRAVRAVRRPHSDLPLEP
jgi:cytochrome b561